MKKFCFLLVVALVLIPLSSISLASKTDYSDTTFEPSRFTLINAVVAHLTISGGVATCAGQIEAKNSGASCSITVKLQKKQTNGSWKTKKTWSSSDTFIASAGGNYSVSSGTYRVYVTGTVRYNGSSETASVSSPIRTY